MAKQVRDLVDGASLPDELCREAVAYQVGAGDAGTSIPLRDHDNAWPHGGKAFTYECAACCAGDMKLRDSQGTHVRGVRLIQQRGEFAEHGVSLRHSGSRQRP